MRAICIAIAFVSCLASAALWAQSASLDGDVTLKSAQLAAIKGDAGMNVVQIVDKTRGVVCYLVSNQLSCVKYGN